MVRQSVGRSFDTAPYDRPDAVVPATDLIALGEIHEIAGRRHRRPRLHCGAGLRRRGIRGPRCGPAVDGRPAGVRNGSGGRQMLIPGMQGQESRAAPTGCFNRWYCRANQRWTEPRTGASERWIRIGSWLIRRHSEEPGRSPGPGVETGVGGRRSSRCGLDLRWPGRGPRTLLCWGRARRAGSPSARAHDPATPAASSAGSRGADGPRRPLANSRPASAGSKPASMRSRIERNSQPG